MSQPTTHLRSGEATDDAGKDLASVPRRFRRALWKWAEIPERETSRGACNETDFGSRRVQ